MNEFGKILKDLRKKKDISQRELASKVDVDFTYISKIENDTNVIPSEETIIKIANVLGENPDRLIIAAKKVPSDLNKVIVENEDISAFLRKAPRFSPEQWDSIRKILKDTKDEK